MPDDPISMMSQAREEAGTEIVESVMFARAELVRPAIGKQRPREDVLAEHQRLLDHPDEVGGLLYDELQARFKLQRDAPIPLRFVYLAILAKQETDKEARKNAQRNGAQMPQPFDTEGSL